MPRRLPITFENIWTKALKEGSIEGLETTSLDIVAPLSGPTTIAGLSLTPIETYLAKSFAASLFGDAAAVVQMTFFAGPSNNVVGQVSQRFVLKNSTIQVPLDAILTPGSAITATVRDGDGSTSLKASASLTGIRMTADLNFGANKVILWIGDSILRGTSMGGVTYSSYLETETAASPEDHYAFQVRNHFQRKGIDCRLVIKAMGSHSAKMMGYWLRNGWFDIDQADVIFYQLGTNDVGFTSTADYTAEIDRLIDWRQRKFPKSPIVLVGPTPLNDNTAETSLAAYRSILASKATVTENVRYVSLANAFDRTNLDNYSNQDGTHPNIASNKAMGDLINSWIDSSAFTF